MKKHELLQKAMQDYPKGTRFKSLSGTEFISTGIFKFDAKSIMRVDENGCVHGNVFTIDWAEIVTDRKPEKKYLKIERELSNSRIKIGSEVIVTDGSYMIDAQTKEHVSGIYFNEDGLHEVLKVTKVNQPFETDYSVLSEILSVHNNCEITGFDNRKYYCSRINIKAI